MCPTPLPLPHTIYHIQYLVTVFSPPVSRECHTTASELVSFWNLVFSARLEGSEHFQKYRGPPTKTASSCAIAICQAITELVPSTHTYSIGANHTLCARDPVIHPQSKSKAPFITYLLQMKIDMEPRGGGSATLEPERKHAHARQNPARPASGTKKRYSKTKFGCKTCR